MGTDLLLCSTTYRHMNRGLKKYQVFFTQNKPEVRPAAVPSGRMTRTKRWKGMGVRGTHTGVPVMMLRQLAGHQTAPHHLCAVPHIIGFHLFHKAARHSRVSSLKRASMEVFPWVAGAVVFLLQAGAAASADVRVGLRTLRLGGRQRDTDFLSSVSQRAADGGFPLRGRPATARGHGLVGVEVQRAFRDVRGADVLPGGLSVDG